MRSFEINPYVRVAMRSVLKPHMEIKRRVIFDYELIYIERGDIIFSYADKSYKCAEGDFIFIRPNVPHSFKILDAGVSQPHIHFDIEYDAYSEQVPVSFKDKCDLEDTELLYMRKDVFSKYQLSPFVNFSNKEKALKSLFNIIDVPSGIEGELLQKSELIKLIAWLVADNFHDGFSSDEKRGIEYRIKDFIDGEQGFCMSLEDFEKYFAYDRFYLEKRFKNTFGMGIIAYRDRQRFGSALKFLKEYSVSETAEILGYGSVYTFSRAFKKYYGISPTRMISRL